MASTKITVAGLTGSGKTCYLIGMYYQMSAGLKNFTLSTDEDSDLWFETQWDILCNSSLGEERFPITTDQVSKYDFKLKYSFKEIMSFEWIDYPGQSLKSSSKVDAKKADFMSNLKQSSCLMLFVDGKIFSDDVDDPVSQLIRNGAKIYTTLLNTFEDENHFIPPVVIVITKYDLCSSRSTEDIIEFIKEGFPVLFNSTGQNEYKKLVAIIPVTLGKNITENGFKGEIKPRNIHLPIAFSIWCTLTDYIDYLKSENDKATTKISRINSGMISRIINKSEIETTRNFIKNNNIALNKLSEDAEKLLNELNKNEKGKDRKIPTYLNGTEVDLREFQ